MKAWARWWPRAGAGAGARVVGEPRSSNGASSMHLWWELPGRFVEVAATLEVAVAPSVPRLYFWALQVGFDDGRRSRGAAHLGLQAHPRHPAGAVNFGGYRAQSDGGGELTGTDSPLPSAVANPNTRDLAWRPGRPYRLRIAAVDGVEGREPQRWRGEVRDQISAETTVVRELEVPAGCLVQPVVWSEVFARCDHPSTTVRWSDLAARTAEGRTVSPRSLRTSYQARRQGGCDNTDVVVEHGAVLQVTATSRRTPDGAVIPWPP